MNPSGINFFSEGTDFIPEDTYKLKSWIKTCIKEEGFSIEYLNYIFTTDQYLHKINIDYLNHDTFTDIITFDNSESGNLLEADIFISIERVKENARIENTSFKEELSRVIIHGVLHLMGYKDKTDKEKFQIRKKEDACLSLLFNVPRGT